MNTSKLENTEVTEDYWRETPNDPWGCEKRCVYCGAGDDNNHSYSCPTLKHPNRKVDDRP